MVRGSLRAKGDGIDVAALAREIGAAAIRRLLDSPIKAASMTPWPKCLLCSMGCLRAVKAKE